MIKAITRNKDGHPTLVLGVTKENVRRIKEGEPIYFDLSKLGYELVKKDDAEPSAIMILYGRTEVAIAKLLGLDVAEPKPGQETIVKIDKQEDHPKKTI